MAEISTTGRESAFFPTIWNVLHDGGIDRITGDVPGEVRVFVGIEYLRERFPDEGDQFVVHLSGCTVFSYRLYDEDEEVADMKTIGAMSVTILNAEMHDSVCRVFTDSGVLEVKCDGGSISLDSGRTIILGELLAVAKAYWDEWKSQSTSEN